MDFIMALKNTLSKSDLVWMIMDRLRKSTHFTPVRTNYNIAKLAEIYVGEIVRLHGVPSNIISDRDPKFTSHF